MKLARFVLPVAALVTLLLASCTTPPQLPTRTTPLRTHPTESGYDDPDLVLLAHVVTSSASAAPSRS